MKMNCLERFQELIGGVKKARLILGRERVEIFQANSPDPFQFRVLHERFGHVAQGRGCGILRRELGHARTAVHLNAEVQDRKNDRDRANQLRDRVDRFPIHSCVIAQANRWLLLRFIGDFENDLATCVTSRDLFLRFDRFGKWERLRHDYLDFLLVDQLANFSKLTRIRFNTD
jgi:hypothetical protein